MSTALKRTPTLPLLRPGERLTQAEFHRRYEAYPEDVKFELIGGTVYMASPLRRPHGVYHPELSGALWLYQGETPGVEVLDNTTVILGDASEPQPDLALRILTEYGGQSLVNEDQYICRAPELLAEVAHATRAFDLGQKRADYRRAGVQEYLVLCIEEQEIRWFDFKMRRMMKPNRQGIYRSRVFPGLWLDGRALLERDTPRLIAAVKRGLASREHAAFVKRLRTARHGGSSAR